MSKHSRASYRAVRLKYCKAGALPSDQDARHLKNKSDAEIAELRKAQNAYFDAVVRAEGDFMKAVNANPEGKMRGPHASDEKARRHFGKTAGLADKTVRQANLDREKRKAALKSLYEQYGLASIFNADSGKIFSAAQAAAERGMDALAR